MGLGRLLGVVAGLGLALGMAGLALSGRAASRAPSLALAPHIAGSGFVVAPGLVVTNAHVVLRCQGQALFTPGLPGSWRVLAEDRAIDLALLQNPALAEPALSLSGARQLPRGLPVLALGFPAEATEAWPHAAPGHLLGVALTVHDPEGGRAVSFTMTDREGRVIEPRWDDGLRYFGADKADRLRWRLEIDASTSGGHSGGPVLDGAGNVVGVVYAGRRGVTSAVPLADLRDFLHAAGVAPQLRPPSGGQRPNWNAVEREAAGATLRVGC